MKYKSPRSGSDLNGAPSVLLTDTNRWPAPARLAMGLAQAGCDVSAVCASPGHPLLKTRAVRQAFSYSGLRPLESVVAAIDATRPELIIPCDDRGVQHLHELYAQAVSQGQAGHPMAELIERSLGAPENYPTVSSRYELLRVAREEGILVPRTECINTLNDLQPRCDGQTSWVLKADGTWGGRGVRFADTLDQARQAFLELTSPPSTAAIVKRVLFSRDRSWLLPRRNQLRPSVIAQSRIHGRPANCAVVCWKGQALAGIAVEVVSSNGVKGPAIVVRVVDSPEMMFAAERIAARLGLSGFVGFDFMIEDGRDAVYLIEMNPRCTPLCHLQLGERRDLVGALWAQLAEQPHRAATPLTLNDMIAYFPQALNAKSEFLDASFHDVPQGEPALTQELLHPWSDRSLLGRTFDRVRQMMYPAKTAGLCAFTKALAPHTSSPLCSSDRVSQPAE